MIFNKAALIVLFDIPGLVLSRSSSPVNPDEEEPSEEEETPSEEEETPPRPHLFYLIKSAPTASVITASLSFLSKILWELSHGIER